MSGYHLNTALYDNPPYQEISQMHGNSTDQRCFNKLTSELLTYTLVNWNEPKKRLKSLRNYIKQTRDLNIDLSRLGNYIRMTRDEIGRPLELSGSRAVVITSKKEIEILKFGSTTCPRCSQYKNNFRECPHCGYFEF